MRKTPELMKHATARLQQRSIPSVILEVIHLYSVQQPTADGAYIAHLNKFCRKALDRELGTAVFQRIHDLLDYYLIQDASGRVITLGWRTSRIQRELRPRRQYRDASLGSCQ